MPTGPLPGPAPATLRALGSDEWAVLLRLARTVLAAPEHADDPTLERFRAAATSRLVGGPLRRALCQRLATDEFLWRALATRLRTVSDLPPALRELLEPSADDRTGPSRRDAGDREERERLRRRLRDMRAERDTWRRRAEGAEARADRLVGEVARLEVEVADLVSRVAALTDTVASAAAERDRAVDRERRRRDGEVTTLTEELAGLRRAEERRRTETRRREEARQQAALDAQRTAAADERRADEQRPLRIVPGRPSRLPSGVKPGTTEAARELLHRRRRVFVDGYNVTMQHRGTLDLETQRTWLVQQLGLLARQRGVRPLVVFDGQASGGGRPPAGLRDVEVRFTDAGITADDELVLAVEATDEPVVVVTDDRELIERVEASGADVVGTRSFLGVLG